jgi:tetratricopeptide (TPR) repeat protein
MRTRAVFLLLALVAAGSACASKTAPPAVVAAPRFPEYLIPPVPEALAGSSAVTAYGAGWNLLQSGDFKSAERAFATALQSSPAFYPAQAAAGYLELARKDPAAALPHFDRAIELQRDYVSALLGRGQALVALNREGEAAAAFESALAADPTLTDLLGRIDVLRFRGVERDLAEARRAARSNRPQDAIRLYQAAIETSPESAFLYRELGLVERQSGQGDLALLHFQRAVALDPADAAALAQIGELLEAKSDIEGALAAYTSSLSIESNATVEARRDAVRATAALARLPEQYRAIGDAPQLTRADLAALIGIRLAPMLPSVRTGDAIVVTDVRSNWAEPWIMTVVRAGVMEPFENHTFQPRNPVRRVDLAQTVHRVLQQIATMVPTQPRPWENIRVPFTDIAPEHLAYSAASAAIAAGVMIAGPNTTFQTSRPVTGAEAIEAVTRLEKLASLPTARDTNRR